jgi:hypothetical protein
VTEALNRIKPRIDAEPHVIGRVLLALGRGLKADPALRPDARELARELESLSRRVRGPSLREFARDMIPRVDVLVGHGPVPASGVLIEGTEPPEGAPIPERIPARTPARVMVDERIAPPVRVDGGLAREPESEGTMAAEASFFSDPEPTPVEDDEPGPSWLRTLVVVGTTVVCSLCALFLGSAAALGEEIWEWIPMPELSTLSSSLSSAEPLGHLPEVLPTKVLVGGGKADVRLDDASSLVVRCGDVTASGVDAVQIVDFEPGPCRIEARWSAETWRTEVELAPGQDVRCLVEHGALGCS